MTVKQLPVFSYLANGTPVARFQKPCGVIVDIPFQEPWLSQAINKHWTVVEPQLNQELRHANQSASAWDLEDQAD